MGIHSTFYQLKYKKIIDNLFVPGGNCYFVAPIRLIRPRSVTLIGKWLVGHAIMFGHFMNIKIPFFKQIFLFSFQWEIAGTFTWFFFLFFYRRRLFIPRDIYSSNDMLMRINFIFIEIGEGYARTYSLTL